MDNFYDARRATEDMFDGQEVLGEENTPQDTPQEPQQEGQAQEPQAQEPQAQEQPAQEQPAQENNVVDEAANVAQAAAQAASDYRGRNANAYVGR